MYVNVICQNIYAVRTNTGMKGRCGCFTHSPGRASMPFLACPQRHINPSPHLEGHLGLWVEHSLEALGVAFYSGSGRRHPFQNKRVGWVVDHSERLFRTSGGPSIRAWLHQGPGPSTWGRGVYPYNLISSNLFSMYASPFLYHSHPRSVVHGLNSLVPGPCVVFPRRK